MTDEIKGIVQTEAAEAYQAQIDYWRKKLCDAVGLPPECFELPVPMPKSELQEQSDAQMVKVLKGRGPVHTYLAEGFVCAPYLPEGLDAEEP